MKHFYILLFGFTSLMVNAQTSPVYSVESNYTTQFGYRYFFDRIDPLTGAYTQVAQLPVIGFYTNIKFINCFGNYVFLGVDSASPPNTYYYKLYEVDTATGVVVRAIPTDSGSVPGLSVVHPSATGPDYYGIRQLNSGVYQLVSIDAITGAITIISTTVVLNQVIGADNSVITLNNDLWFGSNDYNNGYHFLYHVNTTTGVFTKKDSLPTSGQSNFVHLYYNCMRDTIYGFISNMANLGGAEQIKIGASGQVIHTANYLSAAGLFYIAQYTMLPDGRYYFRGTNATAYMMDTNSVNITTLPFSGAPDIKLYAAPRMSCYSGCVDPEGVNDITNGTSFSLYPNPVINGYFTVKSTGEIKIELIDLAGRVVLTANGSDEVVINISGFPAAIYGVKITSGDKISFEKIAVVK